MVHVRALPGTPFAELGIPLIVEAAVREAQALKDAGFEGIILENMHDRPYCRGRVGPEITAAMAVVSAAVRETVGGVFPLGIQILAGANLEALAVAQAAELDFIRVEGFVFGHVADEGWIQASAAELLRERKRLGADRIGIWADIQKKHSSHAVTADLGIDEWAHAADFFGADALIVTGTSTGKAASPADLANAKKAVEIPVAIGSGITPANASAFASADAWIVGSSLKIGGNWAAELDLAAVREMVAAHRTVCGGER